MADDAEPSSFRARRCALAGVRAVAASSSRSFARHTHDEYGIGVVVSGAQRSWSGRGHVEAGPGDLITVNPGEVHDGEPIGGSRRWRMLYFTPHVVATTLEDIREGGTRYFEFAAPVFARQGRTGAFDSLYDALCGVDEDATRAEELLLLVVGGIAKEKRHGPPLADRALARVKACIDEDTSAPHALDDLARLAGMSRFQLVRGFAKTTGLTPHAYIVQRRIDQARRLLDAGAALAEAAAACGFADQSHFTRAFARRHGLTPGAYADAMR